jgi:hypothetical protein
MCCRREIWLGESETKSENHKVLLWQSKQIYTNDFYPFGFSLFCISVLGRHHHRRRLSLLLLVDSE